MYSKVILADNLRQTLRPADWPKSGIYCFLHHSEVIEWTDDIDGRWNHVCKEKPYNQLYVRLKAMRPLDSCYLPEDVAKAIDAREKALCVCNRAWAKYDHAWIAYTCFRKSQKGGYSKQRDAYYKADDAYNEAWRKCRKVIEEYTPEIVVLLQEAGYDISWDGKSLIFEGRI